MVIDESGDGEFVEKSKNEQLKAQARKRRDVSDPWDENFDGPRKMALRASPIEEVSKRNDIPTREGDTEDDTTRLDESGDAEQPEGKTEAAEPVMLDNKVAIEKPGQSGKVNKAADSEETESSAQFDTENTSSDSSEESGSSGVKNESEESADRSDDDAASEGTGRLLN